MTIHWINRLIGVDTSELNHFFQSNPAATAEFTRVGDERNHKNAVIFLYVLIATQGLVAIGRWIGDLGFPYYNLFLALAGIALIYLTRFHNFRHNITKISIVLFTIWAVSFPFFIIRLGGYDSPTYPVYIIIIIYILIFFYYAFWEYVYLLLIIFFSNLSIFFLQDSVDVGNFIYRQAAMGLIVAVAISGCYINVVLRKRDFHARYMMRKQKVELEEAYKRLEEKEIQVVQAEKMASLGKMTAGVAHEINNPLTFIDGNLQTLEQYVDDLRGLIELYERSVNEEQRTVIENAKQSIDYEFLKDDIKKIIASCENGSRRISEIVKKLRNFSRLDEADRKVVQINESLGTVIDLFMKQYPEIRVTTRFSELPGVDCHPGQINQAILAILENSVDAVRGIDGRKGQVTIRTDYDENQGSVRVSISDNGCGIPQDIQSKVFDPFFTTKDVGKGGGLGLSVAHGIIRQHKGHIHIESTFGLGSTFQIELPVLHGVDNPSS